MEDRNAAFQLLGSFPTALVDNADPGLRRQDFERRLRSYLNEQNFRETLPDQLLTRLFELTCIYLRKKKALPQMLSTVNSLDWKTRAKLLERISTVIIPKIRAELLQQSRHARHQTRSKAVILWTSRQLKNMSQTLLFAFRIQQFEHAEIKCLKTPPIDSQFLYDIRAYLRHRMRKMPVKDIDMLVAGCAVAAHIFSPEEAAKDVVSRIPMRISRTKRTIYKQSEIKAGDRRIHSIGLFDW